MAIIGITTNRKNPPYTKADFCFWMPQFKKYMETEEGDVAFNNLYEIANNKVFKSIFGSDWKMAMSLCIAHYLTLIGQQMQTPSGDTLESISGGVVKGTITSASVGGFSKSFETKLTISEEKEALFWNLTDYGAKLYALLSSKPIASIMVVTSGPIGGAN